MQTMPGEVLIVHVSNTIARLRRSMTAQRFDVLVLVGMVAERWVDFFMPPAAIIGPHRVDEGFFHATGGGSLPPT